MCSQKYVFFVVHKLEQRDQSKNQGGEEEWWLYYCWGGKSKSNQNHDKAAPVEPVAPSHTAVPVPVSGLPTYLIELFVSDRPVTYPVSAWDLITEKLIALY